MPKMHQNMFGGQAPPGLEPLAAMSGLFLREQGREVEGGRRGED